MPIYGAICLNAECGFVFNETRPMAQSDVFPVCPKCGSTTEREYSPITRFDGNAPPVVVFKAPDGSFRFPGNTEGKTVDNYSRLGYERVELRGFAEVRRFEREVNTREARDIAKRVERRMISHLEGTRMRRSEVYNGIANGFTVPEVDERGRRTGRMKHVKLSAFGHDVLRGAMERNNRKEGPRAHDPGFFVDAYSNDRGSRDESRRSDGKRFRD